MLLQDSADAVLLPPPAQPHLQLHLYVYLLAIPVVVFYFSREHGASSVLGVFRCRGRVGGSDTCWGIKYTGRVTELGGSVGFTGL